MTTKQMTKQSERIYTGINNPFYGKKHSEETILKMSIFHKNQKRKPCSEETKRKIGTANRGKKRSEETKELLRKINIERMRNPEYRNNLRLINSKYVPTKETKRKISENHRHYQTEETKNKISETRKKRIREGKIIFSEEAKNKLRIMNIGKIGYWRGKKRPEVKNFLGFNRTGTHPSIETRRKLSLAHKGLNTWMEGKHHSMKTKLKMKVAHMGVKNHYYGKHHSEEIRKKMRLSRAKQICPMRDTKIEIKVQNYLRQLNLDFFTHQYITEIKHSYQCDILIPSMNLVIECDGDYWHNYPIGREIDNIRTKELIEKGFKVLRLWEHEIKMINLNKFKTILEQKNGC